jgi:protein-serine/threonine kinase
MANNNDNRFYLNLNQDRPAFSDRAYPTTPSTFPNPIFPSQGQAAQQSQGQNVQQQQQQPYSTGFGPSGYFMNNPYPAAYPQQPPTAYQQAPPQQASYQQRPVPAQNTDATNGLVHQFSHQNLGGAARTNPYGGRQPSPSQRPRTAGAQGQQAGYGSYLSAPMPSQAAQQKNWPEFEPAPERNPDKYGSLTQTNQKKCSQLAESFFKDSVKRARDRNVR